MIDIKILKTVEALIQAGAELNGLGDAPIRWIVDDVQKFLKREARRGRTYDGIVLDPPVSGGDVGRNCSRSTRIFSS